MASTRIRGPRGSDSTSRNGRRQGYYAVGSDKDVAYVLTKVVGKKGYELRQQFEYVDEKGVSFVVPRTSPLETDLASIPAFASWLVPKDGAHTQAALLHDAMIVKRGEAQNYLGPSVSARKADRMFREGMRISGVKFVRRWLMWTAVTLRTLWIEQGARGWANRARLFVSVPVFALFGLFALPDVLGFPQYLPATTSLGALLGSLGALWVLLTPFLLIWARSRGGVAWRSSVVVLAAAGAAIAGLAVGLPDLSAKVQTCVPSLLPVQFDHGNWGWRHGCNNNSGALWELAWLGGLLGLGAVLDALLWFDRWKFGTLIALGLGLVTFPLFFVAVATLVYLVVEKTVDGIRWLRMRVAGNPDAGAAPGDGEVMTT